MIDTQASIWLVAKRPFAALASGVEVAEAQVAAAKEIDLFLTRSFL
jgi:hypothetical protein